jgi:hypothetical protein
MPVCHQPLHDLDLISAALTLAPPGRLIPPAIHVIDRNIIMRKAALVLASSTALALFSASPVFAFSNYMMPGTSGNAENYSDPDEQIDRLAGTSSDDNADTTIAHFGGSEMDGKRQVQKNAEALDKDVSYSGFYYTDN